MECHNCGADVSTKHHWEYLEDRSDYDEEDLLELADVPLAATKFCMECVREAGWACPDNQVCHDDPEECEYCLAGNPEFFPNDVNNANHDDDANNNLNNLNDEEEDTTDDEED